MQPEPSLPGERIVLLMPHKNENALLLLQVLVHVALQHQIPDEPRTGRLWRRTSHPTLHSHNITTRMTFLNPSQAP